MYNNVELIGIKSRYGGSQATECVSQPEKGATQPTKPLLLPCPSDSGAPLNNPTIEALDSTFDNGSDLYEWQYFANKKELKNKLTKITLKGNL